jgi:hypothetical protein
MGRSKSRERNLFILLGALYVVVMFVMIAFAGTPRTVYGTIKNSDGTTTPANGQIQFTTYIQGRDTDTQTQASPGCGYNNGTIFFNLGNFANPWEANDILVINITNTVNNEKKTLTQTISSGSAAINLQTITLQAKQLTGITISGAASVEVGGKVQFAATGTYDDESTGPVTDTVTWTVDSATPAGAAAFDATIKGQLNAIKAGTATVKAESGAVTSFTAAVNITAFAGNVAVVADQTSIIANGSSTSTIRATVTTSGGGNVVDGVTVNFAITTGTGNVTATGTTVGGVATATFTSPQTVGSAVVTASVGARSGTATVNLIPGPAAKMTLTANPMQISSSAITESTLTLRVYDQFDNLVNATNTIAFTTDQTTFGDIKTNFTSVDTTNGQAISYFVSKVGGGGSTVCTASTAGLTPVSVTVTTAPKTLQGIAVTIVTGGSVMVATPKVGETVQLRAMGTYDIGPIEDITTAVTWSTSDAGKGTIGASTGLYFAKATGAVNVIATLGSVSQTVAMTNQDANPIIIDPVIAPPTTTFGGTIDFGAAVSGGTGKGFAYSLVSGPAGGSIDPTTGVFTAGSNAGEYIIQVEDTTSGLQVNYSVKAPIAISPASKSFKTTDPAETFTVSGATGTGYTWHIMATQEATTPVATPGDYGTWSGTSATTTTTNNFTVNAAATVMKTFYVRVTVAGDADLTEGNGLNKLTVGPFHLIPILQYTITVKNAAGVALPGAQVTVNKAGQTPQTTNAQGQAVFTLPSDGTSYSYTVSKAGYVGKTESSIPNTLTITLQTAASSIDGTVTPVPGTAGATVTAYLPANPSIRYSATTGANGAYTINLPAGVADAGWTIVAVKTGYQSGQLPNIPFNAAGIDFALTQAAANYFDQLGGGKVELNANMSVEIPGFGAGVLTSGYIVIATIAKTAQMPSQYTAGSPTNVYEVTLTDAQGQKIDSSNIKKVIIKIPVLISMIKSNKPEDCGFKIYKFKNLDDLNKGNVDLTIPTQDIIHIDAVGDGTVGSVTFFVDSLSVFAIGQGSSSGEPGGGCFISAASGGSYVGAASAETIVMMLLIGALMGAALMLARRLRREY